MGYRDFAYGMAGKEDPKKRRQEDILKEIEKLKDIGLESDEINAIAKRYIETGDTKLPTTRLVPGEGPATREGFLPSVEQPVRLRRSDQIGFVRDRATGEWVMPPKTETDNTVDIFDKETGQIIGTARKGSFGVQRKSDAGVKLGISDSARGGGAGRDPAQVKAAQEVLKLWAKAIQEGNPTDALRQLAVEAAAYLGLPTGEIEMIEDNPNAKWYIPGDTKRTVKKPAPSFTGKNDGDFDLKRKAAEWLRSKGAPITPANIEAAIKAGKVK